MQPTWNLGLGALYIGNNSCRFRVWAPRARSVEVRLLGRPDRFRPVQAREHGYHEATVEGVVPYTHYFYRLDGQKERPDPASRFQPQGVHGPSQVVDSAFPWHDEHWFGLPLS